MSKQTTSNHKYLSFTVSISKLLINMKPCKILPYIFILKLRIFNYNNIPNTAKINSDKGATVVTKIRL